MLPSFNRSSGRRTAAPLIAATIALGITAGGLAVSVPPAVRGATHVVNVGDGVFGPASLTVAVGDTVTWTNDDDSPHTATAAGQFDSGNLDPGQSFSFTFDEPGTYSYVCLYHDDMTATITVVAASASEAPAPASAAPEAAAPSAAAGATDHAAGGRQPDTALPAPSVQLPAWLAPVLIGLGLVAFAVGVLPARPPARAAGYDGRDGRGGWRR